MSSTHPVTHHEDTLTTRTSGSGFRWRGERSVSGAMRDVVPSVELYDVTASSTWQTGGLMPQAMSDGQPSCSKNLSKISNDSREIIKYALFWSQRYREQGVGEGEGSRGDRRNLMRVVMGWQVVDERQILVEQRVPWNKGRKSNNNDGKWSTVSKACWMRNSLFQPAFVNSALPPQNTRERSSKDHTSFLWGELFIFFTQAKTYSPHSTQHSINFILK